MGPPVEIKDHLEFPFNGLPQGKRVERGKGVTQMLLGFGAHIRALQEPLTGRLWGAVPATVFRVDPLLAFEFQGLSLIHI